MCVADRWQQLELGPGMLSHTTALLRLPPTDWLAQLRGLRVREGPLLAEGAAQRMSRGQQHPSSGLEKLWLKGDGEGTWKTEHPQEHGRGPGARPSVCRVEKWGFPGLSAQGASPSSPGSACRGRSTSALGCVAGTGG